MTIDWYTIFCVFLVLVNVVRSAIRGFGKEFLSFTGLVVGFIVGLNYYPLLSDFLDRWLGWQHSWILDLAGFLIILIPIILLFSWIGLFFRKIFERLDIVWVDSVLGFLTGIVKGMFWVLIVTLLLLNFSYLQFLSDYVYQSRFYRDLTLPVIVYLRDWTAGLPQADFLHKIFVKGVPREDVNLGNFTEL